MGSNIGAESGRELARPGERVLTNEAELRAALADAFLANADSGRHADNDELIRQLGQWQRTRNFACEHKSEAGYLDVAANAHGAEKGLLVQRILGGVEAARPHVLEIGPGGGAVVDCLVAHRANPGQSRRDARLTLIEAPGVIFRVLFPQLRRCDASSTPHRRPLGALVPSGHEQLTGDGCAERAPRLLGAAPDRSRCRGIQ